MKAKLFSHGAKWVWIGRSSRENNTFACFRKKVALKVAPRVAVIQITADSRYELFVNGEWVGHGPERAFVNPWPVDRYEVGHLLRAGENVVAVLVQHFGISTFQYIHSAPGLIAEIAVGRTKIGTDATWKCVEHEGYAWPAPRISCQQGWEEQMDARVKPGTPEVWTTVGFDDRKWGTAQVVTSEHVELEARTIPFLTREVIAPVAVRAIEAVWAAPYTFNLNPHDFLNKEDRTANHMRGLMLLVSVIHSPRAQAIQLHQPHGRPDSKWKLNGEVVAFDDFVLQKTDTGVGHARLKKGRNVLMCRLPEIEHPWWAVINAWTDVAVKFEPFVAFGPFKSSRPQAFDLILVDPAEVHAGATRERFDAAWERGELSEDDLAQPFARVMTKDMVATTDVYAMSASERVDANAAVRVDEPAAMLDENATWTTIYPARISNLKSQMTADVRVLLDFGHEVVGYHEFEIDAPGGAIVDNHNFEFIQRDGRFNLAEGMNNSFRYVCREGVQRYRTFVRRGFRYSWVTFRNFDRPIRVRFVRMLMSTYPQTNAGEFACSDPMLENIWRAGVLSVRCCAEDTYTDCPSYEQTYWVGDARNEAMVDLVANGDPRLSAHCLKLAGRSMERSVVVESQVPSGWENLLPTWSFLWMRWAEEHFTFTGDKTFAKEMLPFIERNVKGITSNLNEKGLFKLHAWNLFDWAGLDTPAAGTVTHLNCFAVLGLRQCAGMAKKIGERGKSKAWEKIADGIERAINAHLWSEEKRAYVDCIRADGTMSPVFSQQTQTAAYIAGVARGEREERCREIVHRVPAGFIGAGSPFYMFFLLEALAREGRIGEMVETIRSYWGAQIEAGATTFWEMFHPKEPRLTRSHCHGWSAAPVVFLTQYVLGVRPAEAGYEEVLIAPRHGGAAGLKWAQGRVLTPHGVIECYWSDEPDRFSLRLNLPRGVTARIDLPGAGELVVEQGRIKRNGNQLITIGPMIRLALRKDFSPC